MMRRFIVAILFAVVLAGGLPAQAQEDGDSLTRVGQRVARELRWWHPLVEFPDVPDDMCRLGEPGHEVRVYFRGQEYTAPFGFHGSGDPAYASHWYLQLERSRWLPQVPGSLEAGNYLLVCYRFDDESSR